ncbi:hypothetical protein DTQ70_00895 [Runella sp. SP2]|nr:hypothetical protein DTQ70_00895 [Runella sp. SP2]
MKKRNGQLIRALLITTVITVGFSNESHAKKLFGSETEWLGTQSDFNGGCVKFGMQKTYFLGFLVSEEMVFESC